MEQRIASVRHTLIVIAIFLALAAAGFYSSRNSSMDSMTDRLQVYGGLIVSQLLLLGLVAVGVKKQGESIWRLFGLVATSRQWLMDVGIAIGAGLLLRGLTEAVQVLVGRYSDHTAALLPVTHVEKFVWVAVAIVAGVCEEVVFRGYLLRQFAALSGNRWVALALQAFLFGVSHGYQGWKSVVVITIYGAGIGLVALLRRNVRATIIMHAATDLIGGLLRI